LSLVYPDLRIRWRRLAEDIKLHTGHGLEVAQGLRTWADQEHIFAQGRHLENGSYLENDPVHHQGIVSYAPPGHSWHNFGLALDSDFGGADPWLEKEPHQGLASWALYANLAQAHGLEAGFSWPGKKQDKPHVEIGYGFTLEECRALFAVQGLASVWGEIDKKRGVPVGTDWKVIQNLEVVPCAPKA
jgi:hypothetical protein